MHTVIPFLAFYLILGLDSAYTNDSSLVRVRCPDLAQEGQWHHLVVVFNKAVMKHTTLSLFVDGINVHSQKVRDWSVTK